MHQHSWALPLVDAGRWSLRIGLEDRPPGPLPTLTIGASPAYHVLERGGEVVTLDVALRD